MEKDNKERMSICIDGLTLLVGRQEQQTIACTVQKILHQENINNNNNNNNNDRLTAFDPGQPG